MKLTIEWLEKESACTDGKAWFLAQAETDVSKVLDALLAADKWNWANWLIAHALDRKNRIWYAIFAAEQVIKIYEDKYPNDDRPRKAIEAAKAVLKQRNKKTISAAYAAAYAADAAADAAYAAYAAYAAAAYAAADSAMKRTIIDYGKSLLKKQEGKR